MLILGNCSTFGGKFRVATPSLESFDYREVFSCVGEWENQPSLRDALIDISGPKSGDALL